MILHTTNNKKQEALLRTKLRPFDFKAHTPAQIRKLVSDMRKKMNAWSGVGLAANQAGFDTQFFVAETEGKFYAIFNPKITKTFGELVEMEEACLSVPNQYGQTKRYEKVALEGQDQTGKKIKIKAWGLLAHIFQHETDHLNGLLYIDHAVKTIKVRPGQE
ncbi:MAG: peptide deformylase [Candidatus Harrisonbacteria bacterium CG10_big_fil_rev_8_21_14_0_10_45_28]|uniref:Peptide deformylase n=1 Tax=Candidatus Harrisonbacteria bacterium CG10_big_fil_rev_8_21_14_0_10_45_28 TaxID=1974586 RepID=A0A2H0UNW5_9BACT|nr:MAG: peptide deformylase [Candidatus Harrisonbacteria bacterium CG10_big_fil_rev_8_21_14_0_10_45_28]